MNIYYNELRVGHHSHYVMNHSQHEPTLDLYATEAWEHMTDGGMKIRELGPRLYAMWETYYHLDYEYPINDRGREELIRKTF